MAHRLQETRKQRDDIEHMVMSLKERAERAEKALEGLFYWRSSFLMCFLLILLSGFLVGRCIQWMRESLRHHATGRSLPSSL